jgi:uncharacterized protein YbjT (DUF2867 family)
MKQLNGKTILITGGTGSFGRAMVDRLLKTDVKEIRIFSRDEVKQELMRIEYKEPRPNFYIGDVRERDSNDNDAVAGALAKTNGKGAVVAGGSGVTKPVGPFTVIGGNPAKLIRVRIRDRAVIIE